MDAVMGPSTQTAEYDWHPRANESFESWVNRLAQLKREAEEIESGTNHSTR